MPEEELPAYLQKTVDKLRSKGGKQSAIVDKLLQKRAEGTPEQRSRIDAMLAQLGKPSRVGPWVALGVAGGAGILGYHLWSERAYEQAAIAGTPTVAQVKRLDEGDCAVGEKGRSCVRLTLEVHPAQGAPYVASLTRDIEQRWMSRVQPGSWLTVAVDPSEPGRVYFDARSMAVEAPAPVKSRAAARD